LKTTKATDGPTLIPNPKARPFDQVHVVMRFHHYAIRTERATLTFK
jgi:hypothetical protein